MMLVAHGYPYVTVRDVIWEDPPKFQSPIRLTQVQENVYVVMGDHCELPEFKATIVSIHKTQEGADTDCKERYEKHKEVVIQNRKRDKARLEANGACGTVFIPGIAAKVNELYDGLVFNPFWVEKWELNE